MKNQYDAIIVGAGVGGLFAGNFLAKKGAKVLICEQHITPGGYACGFERKGYYFDGGVQSFGSYGMLFPLLRELGLLEKMSFKPSRVRFVGPGLDVTIKNLVEIRDAFKGIYPAAAPSLDAFFAELSELVEAMGLFAMEPAIPLQSGFEKIRSIAGLMMKPESRILMNKMGSWNKMKYPELIEKYLSEFPEIRQFFSQICYPDAPLVAYGGMWRGYIDDYWYPENGMQYFADQLARNFNELGGEIRYRSKVSKVLTANQRAQGVLLENGETINARHILWAGDARRLFTGLLDDHAIQAELPAKYEAAPLSASFVSLFLGLKQPAAEINQILQAHHVFYYPRWGRSIPGDEASYFKGTGLGIVSPTFENPSLSHNAQASLVVQTFAPYEWMNSWGTGPEGRRNEEYRRLKERVAADLMESLELFMPGIGEKVDLMEFATPLTMERYTLNSGGASAGWSWDPDLMPLRNGQFSIKTPVRNLLTCGHWMTNPAGIPAAALTGKMAADRIG